MKKGQTTHDMLASDVALIYRWGVTPEGEGTKLTLGEKGQWIDESGNQYQTIEDAY